MEHDRRLPYHPLQGAFRYPSFPPLPVGQQIRTTATEYLPPLPPFQEEQRYSREPDIFSNEQRRSFTYPQIQYEPPSREHDVPRDPPPAYPEGSEQELREDTPLYPEPVRPKRIAGPSRENKRKPIPKSAAPDEEEEEVDDQPKKVPRKTLIACGFCRSKLFAPILSKNVETQLWMNRSRCTLQSES